MEKNLFIPNFKKSLNKIPAAAAIFIGLFLITEFCIYKFAPRYITNPAMLRLQEKINFAKKCSLKNDILILGDSAAGTSINANILQARTGLKCFNFALVGDTMMAGTYFLLRDYLLNHEDLKYIILMNVYDIWHRDIINEALLNNFQEDIMEDFLKIVVLSDNYKCASTNIANIVSQLLPSQMYRFEIRRFFESPTGINLYIDKKEAHTIDQEMLRNRGSGSLLENDERRIRKDLLGHEKFVDSTKFKVSKINMYYLDKLLREAKQRNIYVLICFPPIFNEFYNDKVKSEYLSSYKTFIKTLPRLYDNVVLVTDDFYAVPSNRLSLTIDHLNKDESLAYTEMLAIKIREFIKTTGRAQIK